MRGLIEISEQNYQLVDQFLKYAGLAAAEAPYHEVRYAEVKKHEMAHPVCWSVTLMEQTPYTSLVRLQQRPAIPPWIEAYDWRVRLYHDAEVAEVIQFQGQRPLKRGQRMPNQYLHQQDEKNQIHVFLHEWLVYCLQLLGEVPDAYVLPRMTK